MMATPHAAAGNGVGRHGFYISIAISDTKYAGFVKTVKIESQMLPTDCLALNFGLRRGRCGVFLDATLNRAAS